MKEAGAYLIDVVRNGRKTTSLIKNQTHALEDVIRLIQEDDVIEVNIRISNSPSYEKIKTKSQDATKDD